MRDQNRRMHPGASATLNRDTRRQQHRHSANIADLEHAVARSRHTLPVSGCCTPKGYRQIFSERGARAQARSYRRHGLDATSRRIVALLKDRGVEGLTLLEVGGGIGAIQIELLRAGLTRATSVELTPTYEQSALELLREAGFEDRVERRVMDFVDAAADIGAADIVVMNRVICCYPDLPRLAGAAADHARGLLVMSFPKERWWTRVIVGMANFGMGMTRREFRIFLHPMAEILGAAEKHGLKLSDDRTGAFWQISAMRRAS